jgi:hypothetical protein
MWQQLKSNRRLVVVLSGILFVVIIAGGYAAWNYLLPQPESNTTYKTDDSTLIKPDEKPETVEIVPETFEENATEVSLSSLTRCVNINPATSEWSTKEGLANIQALAPTMFRFKSNELQDYVNQKEEHITDLANYINNNPVEILVAIDVADETNVNLHLRTLSKLQDNNVKIKKIELYSSFPELFDGQLTRQFNVINTAIPDAEYIGYAGYQEDQKYLNNYDFDAISTEASYDANLENFSKLPLEADGIFNNLSSGLDEDITNATNAVSNKKPLYITNFTLNESIKAFKGTDFDPYENVRFGGTWAQAIATGIGYNSLLRENIPLVCIDGLSASPQKSLYFTSKNIENSTYTALSGKDFEFTAQGQMFYMLSQAVINTEGNEGQEFNLNNESNLVKVWVFKNGNDVKGLIINGRAGQTAIDMEKYGFIIRNITSKSAAINQVVLSRADVETVIDKDFNQSKVLLAPYSISVMDLQNIKGFDKEANTEKTDTAEKTTDSLEFKTDSAKPVDNPDAVLKPIELPEIFEQ